MEPHPPGPAGGYYKSKFCCRCYNGDGRPIPIAKFGCAAGCEVAWGGGLCGACAPGEASCPLCDATPLELTAAFAGTLLAASLATKATRVLTCRVRVVVDRTGLARLQRGHPGEEGVGWRVEGFVRGPRAQDQGLSRIACGYYYWIYASIILCARQQPMRRVLSVRCASESPRIRLFFQLA